jgi:hypothetical protein
MKGVRNGVSIFLSTGYCVGTVFAMLLNAILPIDGEISYNETDMTNVTKKLDDKDEDKEISEDDSPPEAAVPMEDDVEMSKNDAVLEDEA